MQHVFIIGSKGIPAQYGGYETFLDKLTLHQKSPDIRYHIACAVDSADEIREFEYHGAHCFTVLRRPIGPARAVLYDIDALRWCIEYAEKHQVEAPIFYILACRIGPVMRHYVHRIHALGGRVFVNPDGHEWKRAKWSLPVRRYWKLSERLMVKYSDLIVCDSENIEKYIRTEYANYRPSTTYIAYGADLTPSSLGDDDPKYREWMARHHLEPDNFYLVVGRFVPENNYEIMIREFMASTSSKSFALVTGVNDAFLNELANRTGFRSDPRIKFVGTVYDGELLKKIRENAFAYLHGHEVGGTNPSLLEALATTKLNMLLDVGFNREVAREDAAVYWTKAPGNLANLINHSENMSSDQRARLSAAAKREIRARFTWESIGRRYHDLFTTPGNS